MCPCVPDRIGICWFLSWGQNRSPGGKPLRARERTTTNSTHKRRGSRDLNPGDTDGGWVLSPLYHPCSPCFHIWWNTPRFCLLFFSFLSRFCTTTTWKCLISRFMEVVNKQRRNFISLSELEYGPLKFSFRRVRLPLTKQVGRNNRYKHWKK